MQKQSSLLNVNNLKTYFYTDRGINFAVNDVSFSVNSGEVLGIIGESGSGKSVTALSILRLVPNPPGRIVDGKVELCGEDLLSKSSREMTDIRGNRIAMVFQDPMTSLDPSFTVGDQLFETIRFHRQLSEKEIRSSGIDMLTRVKIPAAEERLTNYPFQLSGGLRQRVMIAIALSCQPELLIADEPTTALDVTIQAQLLELLNELQKEFGMSIIFISHDFNVISEFADRVAVMYGGRMVEIAEINDLFDKPGHPYTEKLLLSRPVLGRREKLVSIEGSPPDLLNPPPGCPFAPRCEEMSDICWSEFPEKQEISPHHIVHCYKRGN